MGPGSKSLGRQGIENDCRTLSALRQQGSFAPREEARKLTKLGKSRDKEICQLPKTLFPTAFSVNLNEQGDPKNGKSRAGTGQGSSARGGRGRKPLIVRWSGVDTTMPEYPGVEDDDNDMDDEDYVDDTLPWEKVLDFGSNDALPEGAAPVRRRDKTRRSSSSSQTRPNSWNPRRVTSLAHVKQNLWRSLARPTGFLRSRWSQPRRMSC